MKYSCTLCPAMLHAGHVPRDALAKVIGTEVQGHIIEDYQISVSDWLLGEVGNEKGNGGEIGVMIRDKGGNNQDQVNQDSDLAQPVNEWRNVFNSVSEDPIMGQVMYSRKINE